MSMNLFKHNNDAYFSMLNMLKDTNKAAIIHPTGTGKSFIGFKLCEDNLDKVVCWLAPSEYIYTTQIENWKKAGGCELSNIEFYTYARLMHLEDKDLKEINPDYIVLDEFHRCGADMWGQGIQRLIDIFKDVPLIGLSATAIRYLDNQRNMADELFDGCIASEISLGDAIVRGILNSPTYILSIYSYSKDILKYQKKINKAKNKYVRDEAQKYLDALRRALEKSVGLKEIFGKYIKNRNSKYIVFCSSVEHMNEMLNHTREWFSGIDSEIHVYAAYSDNPTSSAEFSKFKEDSSDHLKLLFCIDMLNEGVHVEKIDGVILFRPTVSPIIYKQQIGRALSASKDKEPIIFDIVNNIENLYSIGTIEQEMKIAITYYRSLGLRQDIVNDKFKIIDDLRNTKKIFAKLNDTLGASWDLMYEKAKEYFHKYGNLEVEKRYKTKEGYSLGSWINTQRRVYKGEQYGDLSEEKIRKLNDIGMVWDNIREMSWQKYYSEAKKYYLEHNDLDVPVSYVSSSGVKLGTWISNLRSYKKCAFTNSILNTDKIRQLEDIKMIWDKNDWLWDKYFLEAKKYYEEFGNLDIPKKYVTSDGLRLGMWLHNNKAIYRGSNSLEKLTTDRIAKLDSIGIVWNKKSDIAWNQGYEHAKAYFEDNGYLDIPSTYVCMDGYKLGDWILNQRDKGIKKLSKEQVELLNQIGMNWLKKDPWKLRFDLAKEYYNQYGNLNVPLDYKPNGIWLNKWVSEQRQIYFGNRGDKRLSDEQIDLLESIGMIWNKRSNDNWNSRLNKEVVIRA